MKKTALTIDGIPALLLGEDADKVYLFVHGRMGCKEEAEGFAALAALQGWQVLSIDLPQHGERKGEQGTFYPWVAVPEIKKVMEYSQSRWREIGLYATSIGAYFSMLALADAPLSSCLLVAPLLDMEGLIRGQMASSHVTQEQLEKEQIIPTAGDPLEWRYLRYAMEHPTRAWAGKTAMLCPEHDEITPLSVSRGFAAQGACELTVLPGAAHWIHLPQDVAFLNDWAQNILIKRS